MERLRRLFVVLVWVVYTVTVFMLTRDLLDHSRGGENASLLGFGIVICVVTVFAVILHKAVNWIMMKDEEPEK